MKDDRFWIDCMVGFLLVLGGAVSFKQTCEIRSLKADISAYREAVNQRLAEHGEPPIEVGAK